MGDSDPLGNVRILSLGKWALTENHMQFLNSHSTVSKPSITTTILSLSIDRVPGSKQRSHGFWRNELLFWWNKQQKLSRSTQTGMKLHEGGELRVIKENPKGNES